MPRAGGHAVLEQSELLLLPAVLVAAAVSDPLLLEGLLEASAQVPQMQEDAVQVAAGKATQDPVLRLRSQVEGLQ